jgi:hypothetical protein
MGQVCDRNAMTRAEHLRDIRTAVPVEPEPAPDDYTPGKLAALLGKK